MEKLTVKQQKFCDEYLRTGNATQSAITAGYSKKTARRIAAENLTKLNVKSYIDAKRKEVSSEKVASAQEVLEFQTSVMRGEEKDHVLKFNSNGEQTVIETHVTMKDRLNAADKLARILGMYADKVKVEGVHTVIISGEDALED